MAKPTTSARSGKAAKKNVKPQSVFPLWKHPRGYWCRKINGRFHYFGRLDDDPKGDAALQEWLRVKDYLLAGSEPPPPDDERITVRDLCNEWIGHKHDLLESGDLTQRTFDAYVSSCEFLLAAIGKQTIVEQLNGGDFKKLRARMARSWGPVRLKNEMGVVESIFRFGDEAELFNKRIRFGPAWTKPTAKTLRKKRAEKGPRLFEREDLLKVLHESTPIMRAMVLLGINGGLGNTDIGLMPIKAVNLETAWLVYPRPKTGIERRIPLWPETVKRLKTVLDERTEPKNPDDAALLFIGRRGLSYVGNHRGYRVTQEFDRACKRAGVEGRTFYDLRRTFQTIGEEAGDLVAVQSVMGHAAASGDMSAVYRQRVSEGRLRKTTEYIRAWLFGDGAKGGR